MRKAYAILCCLVVMMLPLSAREAGIWFQANNNLAFGINLSNKFDKPTGEWESTTGTPTISGRYNFTSYLGKVGSYNLSQPVDISISCDKTDVEGNFIMASDSGNSQIYRHFKLAMCYRKDNDNYLVDGTNFCFEIDKNGESLNDLPDSTNMTNGCWVDFVLVMDDVSKDKSHMANNNDYHANITITVSDGGSHKDTYTLSMTGYYNYQEPPTQGVSSLQLTDYNALINIKQMNQYSSGKYGTAVGGVDFETRSFSASDAGGNYITNSLSSSNCFSISISSDMNYGSNDFVLKKVSSSISSYNDYNSIPIRVFVKPDSTTGYALDYTIDSGSDDLIAYAKRNLVADAGNGWGTIANFEYKGTVYVCLADNAGGKDYKALAQTLTAGEYDCDIYFFVITP